MTDDDKPKFPSRKYFFAKPDPKDPAWADRLAEQLKPSDKPADATPEPDKTSEAE